MDAYPLPADWVLETLRSGVAIPAHPLALTRQGRLDERRLRGLTRYYHAAGAGGIAAGVHTTQFEIRMPEHALFEPVLRLIRETLSQKDRETKRRTIAIAGICGLTDQAKAEAIFARESGYDLGLLSLSALRSASDDALIQHCKAVAREIPLIGFYLQPAVGGRVLSAGFWRQFALIPNVVAIKVAPFNRYQTLEVVRAVAEAGRVGEIALYTGNDDNIMLDLLTTYEVPVNGKPVRVNFSGGLLGHWAFWTKRAVELLEDCKCSRTQSDISAGALTLAAQVTESNAAVFDAANGFAGCIPGIHEILRRQGLLENNRCLNPGEVLSPGQSEAIDRVSRCYPHLDDDAFVRTHLDEWIND